MPYLKSLRAFFALAAGGFFLAGCETPTLVPAYPEITWTHVAPLVFDAGRIEIIDKYRSPLKHPNVEYEFPIVPEVSIKRWISDRIRAAGGPRTVRITIKNASVVGQPLKLKKGLEGLFFKEQAARYRGELNVMIEIRSPRGFQISVAEAKVVRSKTVAEDTSPNDLDQIFFDFTAAMMADLDRTLEANIRRHMARELK
jgi:hypothetical protein